MKTAVQTLSIVLLLFVRICTAGEIPDAYEVGTWQGFRTVAVTYTFDDNTPKQFSVAIPLFNEFDFDLTLFIVTDPSWEFPADWTTLQEASAQGHEVASHTVTHTSFSGMPDSLQHIELADSKNTIESCIPDPKCISLAYPFCVQAKKSICQQYYIGARICSASIVPKSPNDFMNISSIICGTEGSVKTADHFISKAKSAIRSNGWCVYLLHGVDEDGGWSPVTSETLRETLEYYDAHRDSFWVETFGNVIRYIRERDALNVTELSADDNTITFQVTDTLDNEIFNHPLTLRRLLPEDWPSATVTQNAQPVEAVFVRTDDGTMIQFDAVPDHGDVVLEKNMTGIHGRSGLDIRTPFLSRNYPNPFNPYTTIRFDLPQAERVTLQVYDNIGRGVRTLLDERLQAGPHSVVFDGTGLASGVYFYHMQSGNIALQRKMLLLK
ncbi:polysaccharide deacetylase family protein [bacterium]|nr:polysaccharide deacetylase family protein [bacterium]